MALSFSFKKKIESKLVAQTETQESEKEREESSKSLQSKSDDEELVIPLIKKNVYNRPIKAAPLPSHEKKPKDTLEEEAANEIIKDSKHFLEQSTDDTETFDDLEIPLLLKNKVPEGYETNEKVNVSLRPDESTETNYDQVPVSRYGLAILRGMGWTPEVGIGKTFQKNTKAHEQIIRPKGLGLGADTSSSKMSKNTSKSSAANGFQEIEVLELVKGTKVLVINGSHKNKYGTIIGIDVDTDIFVIKLAIGAKVERIWRNSIKGVTKKEFDRNAKDLSRLSKAYTGKSVTIIDDGGGTQQRDVVEHQKRTGRERDAHDSQLKEKRRKQDKSQLEPPYKQRTKHTSRPTQPRETTWVRPQIRVRIIDKKYHKGRYYREKVVVEDILEHGKCCCKTDDGKILDNINDAMLETVIPKASSDAYVIIVHSRKGKHNGKLAKILEKNKDKCTAMLQLIDDRDVVLEVGFEDMCEYAGDPEMHDMF